MDILDFTPPNDSGEFFAGTPADGCERFYHGTSRYFLDRITEHGFVVQYRLVNDQEVAVLERYAHRMQNVGATLVWSLGVAKRLSLTRRSMLALSYASSGLRGGIYKSLLDDLTLLLAPDAEQIPEQDAAILAPLKTRLEALETEPGLVCAIDLRPAEIAKLKPLGQDPTYAPFDIAPERIIAVMNVPNGQ
jgi:hypothetical protein